MKQVRVTGTPDLEKLPTFMQVMVGSAYVSEARLYDLNVSKRGKLTVLFEVDGDVDRVYGELDGLKGLVNIEREPVTDDEFNLLVTIDPTALPLFHDLFEAITREGLIISKPIVYRDGRAHIRLVGSSSTLQTAIGDLPSDIELEIDAISDFNRWHDASLAMLSDRQREAVMTAFDLGYYEHPRETTHREIADHLGCAPNTVSDHLQKAEKKIIADIFDTTTR